MISLLSSGGGGRLRLGAPLTISPLRLCLPYTQRLHRESSRVAGSLAENLAQLPEVIRLLMTAVNDEVQEGDRSEALSTFKVFPDVVCPQTLACLCAFFLFA